MTERRLASGRVAVPSSSGPGGCRRLSRPGGLLHGSAAAPPLRQPGQHAPDRLAHPGGRPDRDRPAGRRGRGGLGGAGRGPGRAGLRVAGPGVLHGRRAARGAARDHRCPHRPDVDGAGPPGARGPDPGVSHRHGRLRPHGPDAAGRPRGHGRERAGAAAGPTPCPPGPDGRRDGAAGRRTANAPRGPGPATRHARPRHPRPRCHACSGRGRGHAHSVGRTRSRAREGRTRRARAREARCTPRRCTRPGRPPRRPGPSPWACGTSGSPTAGAAPRREGSTAAASPSTCTSSWASPSAVRSPTSDKT